MEDFYIYLPSNVRSEYFENTAANFKTKLVSRLQLKGQYLVGLAEISYSFTWMNINENESISLKYSNKNGVIEQEDFILKKGHYTIENLLKGINKLFESKISNVIFPEFKIVNIENINTIQLICGQHSYGLVYPILSRNLSNLLGFNKEKYEKFMNNKLFSQYILAKYMGPYMDNDFDKEDFYYAESPYDISGGYHTLFVYCDIIKPHLVGNSLTQLIKFVEIPNNIDYGEQVHITYSNIEYYPLNFNEIESIEVDIKDDTGKSIPFSFAKNFVVLHLKRLDNNSTNNLK